MTDYLLLATRNGGREVSPATAARTCAASATWHQVLRTWGLAASFAVRSAAHSEPRSCLVVHASGPEAARWLATGWERVSDYDVVVLPLVEVGARA